MIPQYRFNKTKQHTHTYTRGQGLNPKFSTVVRHGPGRTWDLDPDSFLPRVFFLIFF